jgi:hypothetical protein
MNRLTNRFTCEAMPDPDRRAFFTHTAMAAAAGVAAAAGLHAVPAKGATAATTPTADQRKYMEELDVIVFELARVAGIMCRATTSSTPKGRLARRLRRARTISSRC